MSISATSGVVSNIDYETLISQLVSIKRQSITQLESEKSALSKTSTAFSSLSSYVKNLISAADALRSGSAFSVFTASISDSTIFSATAGSSASAGSHDITVGALARTHKIAADGVATDTTVIASGAGSFSFQVGSGAEQTVAVDSTTTLAGLRDSINALKGGVTATIVNDGSGASPYRLILTSDSSGTASAVTITANDTSLAFSTTLQAAQDASVTVDGLTFTRSSNSISDIVPGVILDLKAADAGKTVTLTVGRDSAEIEKKVKAFVDSYNTIVSFIKANNRYDSETKTAGVFFGDSVARSVWEDLRSAMTSAVGGLPDTMNRLLHIGITTGEDGLLAFDSSKFTSALSSDYDGVVSLLARGEAVSGFGELVHSVASSIDDYVDGRIKGRKDGIDKNIKRVEEDIRKKEDQLITYEEQLRAQFTALETMLATIQNQGSALLSFFSSSGG